MVEATRAGCAVEVRNLSKVYQLYDRPQDRLKQMLWRGRRRYFRDFWALRDVSLQVGRGEVVGIVGHNGAGKSTLLQIICGTLSATSGSVEVNGRISALLELGSGFNHEFTGRENVFVAASVLGLTRTDIQQRMDSILSFADIGDFVDQPVKTYSSGMLIRLAFAVAVCVDPEILVVDEALAVGDEAYRRKCFARMEQMKERGATILFVSHATSLVVDLCDRAMLLDHGELLMSGRPKSVVGRYQELACASAERRGALREEIVAWQATGAPETNGQSVDVLDVREHKQRSREEFLEYDPDLVPKSTIAYAPQGAEITNTRILTLTGKRVNVLHRGQEYIYTYDVRFLADAEAVRMGMLIKTENGVELGGSATATLRNGIPRIARGTAVTVRFRFQCSLLAGTYFVNAACSGLVAGKPGFLHRILDAVVFRIMKEESIPQAGIVDFGVQPEVEFHADSQHVSDGTNP